MVRAGYKSVDQRSCASAEDCGTEVLTLQRQSIGGGFVCLWGWEGEQTIENGRDMDGCGAGMEGESEGEGRKVNVGRGNGGKYVRERKGLESGAMK